MSSVKFSIKISLIICFTTIVNNSMSYSAVNKSIAERIGLTKYVGKINPLIYTIKNNVTSYTFNPMEGPICMRGGPFYTTVREGNSDDLIIYFQDGGVCFSEYCFSYSKAKPRIPRIDLLNPRSKISPVANWNHVYVPYCDGSVLVGDSEYYDNLNNLGNRYHHGLANSTAAFEVAKKKFPNPKRLLVAGSSGGAYGLLFTSILARHYFPETELIVMADSGFGIAQDNNPEFLQAILNEFKLSQFMPKNCKKCQSQNHMTCLFDYFLDEDPNVRVGVYSSTKDTVLSKFFLNISSDLFAKGVLEQTGRINKAHPNRFRRFITNNVQHTSLIGGLGFIRGADWGGMETPPGMWNVLLKTRLKIGYLDNTKIGRLTMNEWFKGLIDNDTDVWVDIQGE